MKKTEEITKNIGISFSGELARRIQRIYARLGYRSITRFIENAVMEVLPREERKYEEIEEAIKSGEYQKWQE